MPHLRRINQLQANHIKMLEEKIALLETTLKTAQQPTPERDLALLFLGTTIFFAAVSLVLIIF